MMRAHIALFTGLSLALVACSGGSHDTATPTPSPAADRSAAVAGAATAAARAAAVAVGEPTAVAETTSIARTVTAGGPSAIAQATAAAAEAISGAPTVASPANGVAPTIPPNRPATATAIAATAIAGGPTAIAHATEIAGIPPTATPVPRLQLTLSGPTTVNASSSIDLELRVAGPATSIAAFNFDIVYDQRLVTLDAPSPDLIVLNTPDREFQCNLAAPSGDMDADPNVGRARLVCFSYGGADAPAPQAPLTVARITLHGVAAGTAKLTFENTAVFTPDAKNVTIATVPAQVTVN